MQNLNFFVNLISLNACLYIALYTLIIFYSLIINYQDIYNNYY